MAERKFEVNINLGQNQMLNMVLQVLGSAPGSPREGQMYFDSTKHQIGFYDGSKWEYSGEVPEATGAVAGVLRLAGDLGGTASSPRVVNLHLAGDTSIGRHKLTEVGTPSASEDAATKGYVDEHTKPAEAAKEGLVELNTDLGGTASAPRVVNLHLSGDTSIGHRLTGLSTPTEAKDATTKEWVEKLSLSTFAVPTANVNVNSHKLTKVAEGTESTDAVNLGQMQAEIQAKLNGQVWKQPARAYITELFSYTSAGEGAAHTLEGIENLELEDGAITTFSVGDRVVVNRTELKRDNGIYRVVRPGSGSEKWKLQRTEDAATVAELIDAAILIEEGPSAGRQVVQTLVIRHLDGAEASNVEFVVFKILQDLAGDNHWITVAGGVVSAVSPVPDGGTGSEIPEPTAGVATTWAAEWVGDGRTASVIIKCAYPTEELPKVAVVQVYTQLRPLYWSLVDTEVTIIQSEVLHATEMSVVIKFATAPTVGAVYQISVTA